MTEAIPGHGGQMEGLARRFGLPSSALEDFSANINPEGPPAAVIASLRESAADPQSIARYPDIEENELKSAIARHNAMRPEQVAVANGFAPLLQAALDALPIRRCLVPVPAFAEYRRILERAHVEIDPHILSPVCNFHYDVEAMLVGGQDAILLANPQNPAGALCTPDRLLWLAARAAERGSYILLDEAFIDYIPEHSLVHEIDRFPNLVVFRSVTKFFAVPGLRVAYLVANPGVAKAIQDELPPWLISTVASRAVSAALGDEAYAARTRMLNLRRRSQLQSGLESLGIRCYPSAANFLLFRLPGELDAGILWRRMIVEHHIVLRACDNFESLGPGHLRAAVRCEPGNARLLHALGECLSQQPREKRAEATSEAERDL